MQRCCWTLVVLIGSSSRPPSRSRPLEQHRLVDDEPIGSVGQPHAPPGGADERLRGRCSRRAARRTCRPARARATSPRPCGRNARRLTRSAARRCRRPRPCCRRPTAGDRSRRRRSSRRGRCGRKSSRRAHADALDRRRIAIDPEAAEAAAEQVHEVAAVAAAGIEHARPAIETAAQQLIEQVDVDLAERRVQLGAWRRSRPLRHQRRPDGRRGDASRRTNSSQRFAGCAATPPLDSTNCFTRSLPRL